MVNKLFEFKIENTKLQSKYNNTYPLKWIQLEDIDKEIK
jgi:hypothetical protein